MFFTLRKISLFGIFAVILFTQNLFSDDLSEYDNIFSDEEGIIVIGINPATRLLPQQMAVLDKDEINRIGAADLAELLHSALNLNVIRNGPYGNMAGIKLRGFGSGRTAFLINGIPANSALGGEFDINQIDINYIERIEVIYGGSDTKYNVSGAMGGVINIITFSNQKPGLRFGFSLSNTSFIPGEFTDRYNRKQNPRWEDLIDTQNISLSAAYGGKDFSLTANVFANRAENPNRKVAP